MFRREWRHAGFSLYRALIALATVFLVQLGCLVGAADEPKAEQKVEINKENELERLRGTWQVKSFVADGDSHDSNFKFIFSRDKCVNEWPRGKFGDWFTLHFEFKLDLKGNQKVMRARLVPAANDDPYDRAQIYRFSGKLLEICYYGDPDRKGTPPRRFDGSAGSGQVLITMERLKDELPKAKRP